jgi:pimeloyl-ACP methyl ester carboxylesterase
VNPGGPGESGVDQVLHGGLHLQTIVDTPTAEGKYFDIISFDPRGVNNTTPRLKCFPDALSQQAWFLSLPDYGLLWSSPSVIGLEWGRAEALGASCSRHEEGFGDTMLRYVNTAQTVEDMAEIVEQIGEWRQATANQILATQAIHPEARKSILERVAWRRGDEKLQFWGFSYGTLLGQTFAAMHPSKISRMVIDGVLDAKDNLGGDWLFNLLDSDKIITKFCQYCFEAGPDRCPLFTGSSAHDIEMLFEEIMMSLKHSPIALPAKPDRGPSLVTYGNVHLRMITAMAFSYTYAESFFHLLADIVAGDKSTLESLGTGKTQSIKLSEECTHSGPFSDACTTGNYVSRFGGFQAISCMDTLGTGAPRFSREDFQLYTEILEKQSKWISPNWAQNKLSCVGYDFEPAWTFKGINPIRLLRWHTDITMTKVQLVATHHTHCWSLVTPTTQFVL